jgi:hypothetical protein
MSGHHVLLVGLEHFSIIRNHLTGFSRLLARQAARRGLVDHKRRLTLSSEREKPAFGGTNSSIRCATPLARCTTSPCAPWLAGLNEFDPSNDSV